MVLKKQSIGIMIFLMGAAICSSYANPALTVGQFVNISPTQVPFCPFPCTNGAYVFTQCVTVDPNNPSTLYLAVADYGVVYGGVYKSTDGGSTWVKSGPMDQAINVCVDPTNPLNLYASDGVRGATAGVWASTDGGKTWAIPAGFVNIQNPQGRTLNYGDSLIGSYDVYHVDADPTNFKHILVSFHSPWIWTSTEEQGGVIESFDGGKTFVAHWDALGACGAYGHGVNFLYNPALGIGNNQTWIVGTQGMGFWRTTDAGHTYTEVSTNAMTHGGEQIYYAPNKILYISASPTCMSSTDNGATWTNLTSMPGNGYLGIIGDGNYLYAAPDNAGSSAPAYYSPMSNGNKWTVFGSQQFTQGAFGWDCDTVNGIVYNASQGAGLWAMKVNRPATGVITKNSAKVLKDNHKSDSRLVQLSGSQLVLPHGFAQGLKSVDIFNVKGKLLCHAPVGSDGVVKVNNSKISEQMVLLH